LPRFLSQDTRRFYNL